MLDEWRARHCYAGVLTEGFYLLSKAPRSTSGRTCRLGTHDSHHRFVRAVQVALDFAQKTNSDRDPE
jgi:hypothetical protein